jgi:tartrate dehydratase alpha subunit/fumarate hydratase class I-like protein
MREITSAEITAAVDRLARRARSVLPPERAILLECAFESEPPGSDAARAMEALIERFKFCAETGTPLFDEPPRYYYFAEVGRDVVVDGETRNQRDAIFAGFPSDAKITGYTRYVPGDAFELTVAPLEPNTVFGKMNGKPPAGAQLTELATELARFIFEDFRADAAAGAAPTPPIAVGIGFGETEELARIAAARALFRPADKASPDKNAAAAERRILALLNRGGEYGGHTALTVAIERDAAAADGGRCAYLIGGAFTGYAKTTL